MNLKFLGMGIAALSLSAMAESAPTLDGTYGAGIAVGAQRYEGSFGDNAMPYYRAHLEYRPFEDFGARAIGGFGNISNGSSQFRTEWFSNIGIQGVYQPRFEVLGAWRPYVATGVSTDFGTVKSYGTRTYDLDWNFYLPVELGVEWIFSQQFSATAFVENRIHAVEWDKLDGVVKGSDDYYRRRDELPRAGLGLTWRFGGKTVAPAPIALPAVVKAAVAPVIAPVVVPVIQAVDSDRDGVLDLKDKCPNTPAGVKVDENGCPVDSDKDGVADYQDKCPGTPAGVKVTADGCPVDSDKDGVADYLDKCPNTPAGVKVTENGCPVDSDKDGVADYQDKCPGTPAGVKVDSSGCVEIKIEKGMKLTLDGILFNTGKAEIDTSSAPTLAHAAEAIKKAATAKIEIAGFSDNVGNAKKNQALSAKRAEAVKAYLVKLGVPAKQISSKGYGPAQPIADNKTEEGRAKNRRIEFRVK